MISGGCLILVIMLKTRLMRALGPWGVSQQGKQSLEIITLLAAVVQD
jgi:hypothetical protein